MSMLLLQTFLLMLTAFFLGALVACLIKSTFFDAVAERTADPIPIPAPILHPRPAAVVPQPPPRPAPDPVRPKIETVARPASAPAMPIPDAQRFERALREQTTKSAPPAAAAPSATAPVPPRPAAVVAPPAVAGSPAAPARPVVAPPAAPRVEVGQPVPLGPSAIPAKPAATVTAPATSSAPPPAAPPVKSPEPVQAAKPDVGAAAAIAAAAAMAASHVRAAPPPAPAASPKPAAPTPSAPTPAAATPAPRPIMPVAAGSAGPAAVSAPVAPAAPAKPEAPAAADDLTMIRAIDAATQSRLNAIGVRRYSDLARLSTADVARLRSDTGIGSRITAENWIEQAQILARGETTAYARRRAAQGQAIKTAMPTPDAGAAAPIRAAQGVGSAAPASPPPAAPIASGAGTQPRTAAPPQPAVPPAAPAPAAGFELPRSGAQAAAAAAAAIAAAAAASARRSDNSATQSGSTSPATGRDDFQRIHGINVETEKLLNAQGITRYAQIAGWSAVDTERLNGLLGSPGRIARENWIEQAAVLAGGGAGAYARRADIAARAPEADTSRPARLSDALREREAAAKPAEAKNPSGQPARPDLSNLRSVRSEALRGEGAAAGTAADDLKRIRGIGVLIEKKLNSLGVSNYEQIANWTGADIDRISQILDFKGRIERENWVEQARILASGGKTEFSQRVDKGDA